MKQVTFQAERTLALRDGPVPTPGDDQALLRTLITGISAGTEGMWWNATATALKSGRKSYPYIPGYELVGEVIAVGSAFKGLAVGDRVFAMKPHASHALIGPKDVWFRLPAELPAERALAIALTGTSLHAIHRSGISLGDSCAVTGLGVLGLNLVQVLAHAMSCPVVAITGSADKQALALRIGASAAVGPQERLPAPWQAGVHAAFDCSGVNAGLDAAVRATADQGVVVAAGFYTEPMRIDGEAMFARELTIRGVRGTGVVEAGNPFNRWDRGTTMDLAARLVFGGAVCNDALITHRTRVDGLRDAYQMIVDKTSSYLQVVIDWQA